MNETYLTYDQVPYYRKQWFFWLAYVLATPIALGILITGDVYYQRNREVRSFGPLNRIVALAIAVGCIARIIEAFRH
jgi:hypothetical protein